jgi:beta-lactamase class A
MKLTRRRFLLGLGGGLLALRNGASAAVNGSLRDEWRRIAGATDGTVGAAALHLASGQLVSLNGDERFPLASVCKLPIAMNLLALVDEGKLTLNQPIEVLPRDVVSLVSDIARRWPAQRRFPLDEMVELMVAHSDNTAVETLFRIGGGGSAMADRFREWKVEGVRVDRSERQCRLDSMGVDPQPPRDQWTDALIAALVDKTTPETRYQATQRYLADPRDTGTPNGTVQLLARAFRGEILSRSSTTRLIEILKATTTFPMRLKGLLPAGTIVAHKTGSTGTVKGLTAATNDSGVIFLPDGGRLAVSVYVEASTRTAAVRDGVIARVAKAAFDYYQ